MKYSLAFVALAAAVLFSEAASASDTPDELAQILERAGEKASAGDFNEAIRITNSAAVSPKNPTEVMEQASKIQEIYRGLERLGQSDGIERVSMRFVGDSFFRLRVVEKRSDGVILWTFVGYKFRDQWFCKGIHLAGNSDLLELMREQLDAADAR
jgi:hypothetical protein